MKFNLVLPSQIEADWERIGATLTPAIAYDHKRQAIDVYRDLINGDMALFDIDIENAKGIAVIEFGRADDGQECCWIIYIAGKIAGKPREWVGRVRALMTYFETIARANACKQMRIEGRDWSRVFHDWTPVEVQSGVNELMRLL